ncbi:MAG TPA: GNAT family N-acetyltransferase [Opitutaceae bacterium]|nr:GNAT family N-acetyltransferase [Opitutaceae bacterium]
MPADVLLRDATEADLPAVQAIYAHHVLHGTGTFEEIPPDVAEMRRRLAEVRERGFPWLVAVAQNRVVGYAYANWFRARTAYRFACEDSIYLAPDWCARGLGTRLLGELLARCEAAGARQMLGVIGDSANHGSVRLHARLGFEHIGTMRAVGLKFGRWLDVVIMQRALGAGAGKPPEDKAS